MNNKEKLLKTLMWHKEYCNDEEMIKHFEKTIEWIENNE